MILVILMLLTIGTEIRAELARMEKVIDAMIGPEIEKHRREQQELRISNANKTRTPTRPLMPQIKSTVSLFL